jgi:hypothetical protein
MSTSPSSLGPQPPLDKEDLKNIREGYASYKRKVDDDTTALKGGDFEDILGYVWRLLGQVDFLEKKVIRSILYHGAF